MEECCKRFEQYLMEEEKASTIEIISGSGHMFING